MSAYGSSVPPAEIGASPGTLQPSTHESDSPPLNEKTSAAADVEDTTMHWMSPSTRKRQYEKIDRANSGLGGMLRRFVPRCVSGPGPQRFYEEEKSDAGSVRRYRMDLSDEEGEARSTRSTSALRMQRRKLERSTTQKVEGVGKRFGCF